MSVRYELCGYVYPHKNTASCFQVLHAADLLILVTLFEPLSWQEEYNDEDDIGTLDCGHDFHTKCIKQWLMQKNLCPICKTTALLT